MTMTTKTVTELAELFGVSRQAMNNRVRGLEEDFKENNDKGFTVVNGEGIKELERLYGKVVTAEQEVVSSDRPRARASATYHTTTTTALSADSAASQDATIFAMLSSLMEGKDEEIERLNAQLMTKDQQINMLGGQLDIKDHQIAEKDKQLDQQQQLTAAALSDREDILLELKDAQENQRIGFFARTFGRNKKRH